MQSESHLHLVIRHPSIKCFILSIGEDVGEFVNLGNDLNEREERKVGQVLVLLADYALGDRSLLKLRVILKLPN